MGGGGEGGGGGLRLTRVIICHFFRYYFRLSPVSSIFLCLILVSFWEVWGECYPMGGNRSVRRRVEQPAASEAATMFFFFVTIFGEVIFFWGGGGYTRGEDRSNCRRVEQPAASEAAKTRRRPEEADEKEDGEDYDDGEEEKDDDDDDDDSSDDDDNDGDDDSDPDAADDDENPSYLTKFTGHSNIQTVKQVGQAFVSAVRCVHGHVSHILFKPSAKCMLHHTMAMNARRVCI